METEQKTVSTLLERLKEGDQVAFKQLFTQHKQKLFAYCCKITKSEEAAEEIVHDVFLKVWTHREKIDPQRSFDGYLFKITKNQALNFLEKAARDQKTRARLTDYFQQMQWCNHTEDQVISADYERLLTDAVAQLPPRRKLVFEMSRAQGMTHAEIATSLHLSPGTVKLQVIHAVKFIKEYLRVNADITLLVFCLSRFPW